MVTLETPGTGFMPSFCMAFLLFFSDLLCFPREGVPSSADTQKRELQSPVCCSVCSVLSSRTCLLGISSVIVAAY